MLLSTSYTRMKSLVKWSLGSNNYTTTSMLVGLSMKWFNQEITWTLLKHLIRRATFCPRTICWHL